MVMGSWGGLILVLINIMVGGSLGMVEIVIILVG